MPTKTRSFRLSEEAEQNLNRLAGDYKISANMVVNIVLSALSAEPFMENPTAAAEIIEAYFEHKLLSKIQRGTI